MRNDKLRGVFENLDLKNIKSVISSGNVIFETSSTDIRSLEATIEKAISEQLGFNSTTIVRSRGQLEKIISSEPFGDLEHGPKSYLMVTFFKHPAKVNFKFPHQPEGKPYKFLAITDNALFSVTDNTMIQTTDLMSWMEKQFGKAITSRTYKTVGRIIKKFGT
jgi:uncharacterized protein (DUF1697 family)